MPFDPHSHPPVVFKNNRAVFVWLFVAAWMAMLVPLTKNSLAAGEASAVLTATFGLVWLVSLAFTALASCLPKIRVEISPDGVFVRERALLWKRERRFAAKDLSVSRVVENDDNEGVSYACSLRLPGESIVLAQGGSRYNVEQVRYQLIGALKLAELRAR